MKWKKANKKVSGWEAAMASRQRQYQKRRDLEYTHISPRESLLLLWKEACKSNDKELISFLAPYPSLGKKDRTPLSIVRKKLAQLRDYPHLPFSPEGYEDALLAKHFALTLRIKRDASSNYHDDGYRTSTWYSIGPNGQVTRDSK